MLNTSCPSNDLTYPLIFFSSAFRTRSVCLRAFFASATRCPSVIFFLLALFFLGMGFPFSLSRGSLCAHGLCPEQTANVNRFGLISDVRHPTLLVTSFEIEVHHDGVLAEVFS